MLRGFSPCTLHEPEFLESPAQPGPEMYGWILLYIALGLLYTCKYFTAYSIGFCLNCHKLILYFDSVSSIELLIINHIIVDCLILTKSKQFYRPSVFLCCKSVKRAIKSVEVWLNKIPQFNPKFIVERVKLNPDLTNLHFSIILRLKWLWQRVL